MLVTSGQMTFDVNEKDARRAARELCILLKGGCRQVVVRGVNGAWRTFEATAEEHVFSAGWLARAESYPLTRDDVRGVVWAMQEAQLKPDVEVEDYLVLGDDLQEV